MEINLRDLWGDRSYRNSARNRCGQAHPQG